jgi:hypothetical protein
LYVKLSQEEARDVFETIAFLSTVAMVVVFVALYQMDRRSRQEDEKQL